MGTDIAILLLNLGGPLHQAAIKPFLLELFKDRDIIKLGPAFLQPIVANLIVAFRLEATKERYQEIGGGSPILKESAAQAKALEKALEQIGREEKVHLCFRYSQPRAHGVLRLLKRQGIRKVLPVTLYPHDCLATTGSSLRELQQEAAALDMEVLPGVIEYATDPGYLDALEDLIRACLIKSPDATLVFCAHSLPRKQIEAGDPYEKEIHRTVNALQERLGEIAGGYRLAYQSKVGPIKWLEPSLDQVLTELQDKDVILCPVSFVGEHIETLYELDIEYRELAMEKGVKTFLRVPTPGVHPHFIRCLTTRTMRALQAGRADSTSTVR